MPTEPDLCRLRVSGPSVYGVRHVKVGPFAHVGTLTDCPGGYLAGFGRKVHPTLESAVRAAAANRRRALRGELRRLEAAMKEEIEYVND